ncbi:DinB family protein [Sciscionella marina]|uniref:DinB family protein n=1 Tax=Sciscionella marina TaxID=508770 RepID=UPI00035E3E81|nr:DinB family protein [Sciscionella marina]
MTEPNLTEQLSWHWDNQLRPRLDGLTDAEYLWEPVPGSWNIRPRAEVEHPNGSGEFSVDFTFPQPEPPPVTTIAWRLAHLIVGVFGMRVADHFGGPPMDYASHAYPGTAAGALDQVDATYARWIAGVRGLDEAALWQPCGEEGHADFPMIALVLHIHREVIHHGAEVSLLRDLYRARSGA